jgi:hypothetical protein
MPSAFTPSASLTRKLITLAASSGALVLDEMLIIIDGLI